MKLSKYTKETQVKIKAAIKFLNERYGKCPDEWVYMLELLADEFDLYDEVMQSIKENGIYNKDRGFKNPLIATAKDLQASILRKTQHLGISPYANGKLKVVESDSADLLSTILGQNEED